MLSHTKHEVFIWDFSSAVFYLIGLDRRNRFLSFSLRTSGMEGRYVL